VGGATKKYGRYVVTSEKYSADQMGTYPDFIIGGAMKSATSSLHTILATHDCIFIPETEIHFFSIDDPIHHPPFFFGPKGVRRYQDYERDFDRNLTWYQKFFAPARDEQVVGEDSTVYLASPEAPVRIRDLLQDVKLVFLLRNPVDRTYSHYWHRVRKGYATHRFEHELQHGPTTLHLRSLYKPQLQRYYETFSREQIKVILFEQFIENTQKVVDDVCAFLDVPMSIEVADVNDHANSSKVPRWLRLQLWLNRRSRSLSDRYGSHLPGESSAPFSARDRFRRKIYSRLKRWNLQSGSYPPMNPETRQHLSQIYGQKNRGLGKIIDANPEGHWDCL
jgi:hypothetical protein